MALCKLPVGESGFRLQGFRPKDLPAPCGDLADDVPVVNGRKAPGGGRSLFLKNFTRVNVQQLQGLLPPVAQDRAVVHKQACDATLAFASPNQFAASGIQAEQAPFPGLCKDVFSVRGDRHPKLIKIGGIDPFARPLSTTSVCKQHRYNRQLGRRNCNQPNTACIKGGNKVMTEQAIILMENHTTVFHSLPVQLIHPITPFVGSTNFIVL